MIRRLARLGIDVQRFVLSIAIDALMDFVRIPVAVLRAVLGLLSARGRETRWLLLRLLIDALRDLVLIPAVLIAAAVDALLCLFQPPRFFYALRALDERSEELLDAWLAALLQLRRKPTAADASVVWQGLGEALLDPDRSARRARLLSRRFARGRGDADTSKRQRAG